MKRLGGVVFLCALLTAAAVAQGIPGAPRHPVAFVQPTSIELEPSGTLLLVENAPGRILRVNTHTGRTSVLVAAVARPYAVVRTPAGGVLFSAANALRMVAAGGPPPVVARAGGDIGPIAVAHDGTLYFATSDRLFRLVPGARWPVRLAPAVRLASPHGLAVAADGAVLVSDTGADRVLSIGGASGAWSVLARVTSPRGVDVARDGTVYVVDAGTNRVLHLAANGSRIGYLARTSGDLYDVQAASGGAVYVLEAGSTGYVRRIARTGRVTTLARG